MTLQPDQLRYIFGLKLRNLRRGLGLGLKDLSRRAGVSISYISEIEKGLKYPKPDKILALAAALDVPFDELVSLKVDDDLDPIRTLVSSPFLQGFPFELFGLQAQDLLGLITEVPDHAGALIRTFLEVGRSYDVRVEHFLFAALRSYQQIHDNYFQDLEDAAEVFRAEQGWAGRPTVDLPRLTAALTDRYGCAIDESRLQDDPALAGLRSVWVEGGAPELMINGRLLPAQRAFLVAREIGYRYLELPERSTTSSPIEVTSFEQVINDFRAAYFAGAVLVRRQDLVPELEALVGQVRWSASAFRDVMARYHATPETFFYRLTQLLPGCLGVRNLFFMRFAHTAHSHRYLLTKNLNMSTVPVPHGIGLDEHYCRRWPGLGTLTSMGAGRSTGASPIAAQRSHFLRDDSTFFVVSMARPLALAQDVNTSISLGLLIDDDLRRTVRFVDDPRVETVDVGLTCERCALTDCQERAVAPAIVEREQQVEARAQALEALARAVRPS